ncbi:MAG: sulfur carrier protein ThiS [Hydrogenobaculum sp.]|nr:MAG: thiamine biosynthesis protein ThiS [Hydrogenobaculum sp.]HEK25563.1 sulfur carrier protein ThiS [Hydrogenobaculum sp.]
MRIKVNGEYFDFEKPINILELIEFFGVKLRPVGLAVAINEDIVPKSKYQETFVKDGDCVEIIELVGGG